MNNDYKFSIFNYVSKDDIIFNFLTGSMCWNQSNKSWHDLFESERYKSTFLNEGFYVPVNRNEKQISKFRNLQLKYDAVLRITIYPTEQCNFRCTYCYEKFENKVMNKEVEDNLINFVRKNIYKYTGLEVTWFGGEPLLESKRIISVSQKLIDICKRTSRMYRASCITNGYLLDLSLFQQLLRCKVTTFMITLDGPADYHDSVRKKANGAGTFNTIFQNLESISKNCKMFYRVKIRVNISQESLSIFKNYLYFLEDKFGNNKKFSFMFRPVGNWDINNGLKKDYFPVSVKDIYKIVIDSDVKLNCIDHYLELCNSICEASLINGFIIRTNGEICKCNLLLDYPKNIIGKIGMDGKHLMDEDMLSEWIVSDKKAECEKCFMECACGDGDICVAKKLYGQEFDQYMCGYNKKALDELLRMLVSTDTINNMNFITIKE